MKLIVSKGKVNITFECDGDIVPIKSNDGNSYVKGLFVVEETIRIIEFQTIMKKRRLLYFADIYGIGTRNILCTI